MSRFFWACVLSVGFLKIAIEIMREPLWRRKSRMRRTSSTRERIHSAWIRSSAHHRQVAPVTLARPAAVVNGKRYAGFPFAVADRTPSGWWCNELAAAPELQAVTFAWKAISPERQPG